jgi:superfamily II DNA or RNA helicase
MIELRPYQIEARDAVLKEWSEDRRATLLAMATGTGKTETFLSVLAAEHEAKRLTRGLVVAHRRELIDQPMGRIKKHWADKLPEPGIVMANQDDHHAPLVIATIQSLNKRRLEKLFAHGPFSHVVIDEAHHATAASYMTLVQRLKEENPSIRILGVTATPKRADGDGLKKAFESVAYRISIKDAIVKLKALAPISTIAVELPVKFSGIKMVGEEYDNEAAGIVLSAANALEIIVETWKKHAHLRLTMAFTYSVYQAKMLAQAFNDAGVKAEWASGETPKDEREKIIERYRRGETRILVNCQLWTEGFDVPETSCVLMARPTKSDSVYIQAVGRGLRLAPGKADCFILDFAPEDVRNIRMAGDLLGKPKTLKKKEEKAKAKGVILECFAMNNEGDGIDADPDEVQLRVLDYFGDSSLAWTFDGGVASVSVGERTSLAVILPDQARIAKANELRDKGLWQEAYDQMFREVSQFRVMAVRNERVEMLGVKEDWEAAALLAQEYAEKWGMETLNSRKKAWRKQKASFSQKNIMSQLGLPIKDGITKGEAAQAITHKLVLKTLQSKGAIRVSA